MYTMFVARGYPTEKYKTYGIFEFDQAKALAQNGVKVVYAAIDLRSIRRWRRWGIYIRKIDGVEVYSINIPIGNLCKPIKELKLSHVSYNLIRLTLCTVKDIIFVKLIT